jgi:2-amino-4-hydroxy-6-hydroxymethyldihydropteridine diphosphokinase
MRTAYIGMGGNVASPAGEPETTLTAAAVRLESLGRVVARSSLYSTEPVGFADQPRFVNAVVALETELEPQALLKALLGIEWEFGRDRSAGIPNGPRTLDLDILLLGDLQIGEPGLEIPHPRLGDRAFVLVPLNEIASNVLDVSSRKTVTQLLHDWRAGHPGETDVVFPIQSEVWSAGARRDADGPARPERAASRSGDADGRG